MQREEEQKGKEKKKGKWREPQKRILCSFVFLLGVAFEPRFEW